MWRLVFTSAAASARIDRARAWLGERRTDEELLVLGATVESATELARSALPAGCAAFGWHRMTVPRLAALSAQPALLELGLVPASSLALEAVWQRVVDRLSHAGKLGRFAPVGNMPGLPRALRRTVEELRMAEVSVASLDEDLANAHGMFEEELAASGLADRARVLRCATEQMLASPRSPVGAPVVLLDVRIATPVETRWLAALFAKAPAVLATIPVGDERARRAIEKALETRAQRPPVDAQRPLARLQSRLFETVAGESAELSDEVVILSAPGESRECVEIARRIQREADAGVRFDRMAVLLRSPSSYRVHVEESLRRAGVPAWYASGTRKPHPAGRALLSLLACAQEGLSARRFAEYLSLGQTPSPDDQGAPPPPAPPVDRFELPDDDEHLSPALAGAPSEPAIEPAPATVSAPRRWERVLVEAAVIGGLERWTRRLDGQRQAWLRERALPDLTEADVERLDRALADLTSLRAFALPLLDELSRFPREALWAQWLDLLAALASRALRQPQRVLAVLAELAPLQPVGPVDLEHVRAVLHHRLTDLPEKSEDRRFGQVFVAPVEAARGLSFDVVFVPGLAERIFPQKVSEDPVLLDALRARLDAGLETNEDRVSTERLALRLAVGAAEKRVVLSYPRMDVEQARPRVPSFYALEAVRAVEGRLPGFGELARRAERAAEARLGWPAPREPLDAIDAAELDLSALARAWSAGPTLRGGARHLVGASPILGRALQRYRARNLPAWTNWDGLYQQVEGALAANALDARPYSMTALQSFSSCPYRFFLHAILRLAPREEPEPLEALDPLQRGDLVHDVQFHLLTRLRDEHRLPLTQANVESALVVLDEVTADVTGRRRDDLAPAIDKVWEDAVVGIRADLRAWLRRCADVDDGWVPWKFELAFGLPSRVNSDAASVRHPLLIELGPEKLKVRGAIDLVEKHGNGHLRATDHKTGRPRATATTVVGGGETLQPVFYALVLEKIFPDAKVEGGRLYYCTLAGEFSEVERPLDDEARDSGQRVLYIIRAHVERGFFPAAPAKDACRWCDYRAVCGPDEEGRVQRQKSGKELGLLAKLRDLK